jgi:hypothetical protein
MTGRPGEAIGDIERKEMLTSCLSLPRHGAFFSLHLSFYAKKIKIYSALPPTKLDQVRTSEGIPSARGSFSFMH